MNTSADPGSLDWLLECDRSDYNMAASRVTEKQNDLTEAYSQLLRAAEQYGRSYQAQQIAHNDGRDTSKLFE